MWSLILTNVLWVSFMIPSIRVLEGRNIQEWKFEANDTIAYLAVTALKQQRVVSLLMCDVECSQNTDCTVTVYNRSTSMCAMFRVFSAQYGASIILNGNFDVRHFAVNAETPITPICIMQPPVIEHAFISAGSQAVGCVRMYTCDNGYRDTSTNEMAANTTCLENLTWSHVALNCSVPSCLSQPPSLENANVSDGSQLVGSSRTYTCYHGYRDTSIDETPFKTTCLGNLTWSRVTLKCVAHSCPSEPPPIKNAEASGKSRVVGSFWQFKCRRGYMDTSNHKNTDTTRCLDNLTWSQPGLSCSGPWIRKITEATRKGRKYNELTEEELKLTFVDKTLIFQVKTCYDANLMYGEYPPHPNFKDKISIGGGRNTYWKVVGCNQKKEKNIVSCTVFRTFWIRFRGNTVAVGKGERVGEREVLSCSQKRINLIHLRISTYVRNAGTWLFKIHKG